MRNQMSLYLSVETVETVANPFSTRGIDPYYPDLFATNEEKNSVETVENDFFVTVSTELNSKSVANLLCVYALIISDLRNFPRLPRFPQTKKIKL